jgi:hypothetical protein
VSDVPTLTDLWTSFSTQECVAIALAWVMSFGLLTLAYVKTTRWDLAWKARWEQRHGASLEALRRDKQRMLKVLIVIRWAMLAVVFMSLGASFGPFVSVIKGLHREPTLILIGFALLILLTLLLLTLVAGCTALAKYQLRRIDELLMASTR